MTHAQKVSAAISHMAEHWKEIERLEYLIVAVPELSNKHDLAIYDIGGYIADLKALIAEQYTAYRAICKERLLLEREWEIKDSKPAKEIPVKYPYHAVTEHNTEMYNEYKQSA